MCLQITQTKPYNNTKIRYKILEYDENFGYRSLYTFTEWKDKKLSATDVPLIYFNGDIANRGIHVFNRLEDAKHCFKHTAKVWGRWNVVLVKVEVSNFLGAGIHKRYADFGDGLQGEVWNKAKIVKVLRKK